MHRAQANYPLETSPSYCKSMWKAIERHDLKWGQTARVCPETASGEFATAKEGVVFALLELITQGNEAILDHLIRILHIRNPERVKLFFETLVLEILVR